MDAVLRAVSVPGRLFNILIFYEHIFIFAFLKCSVPVDAVRRAVPVPGRLFARPLAASEGEYEAGEGGTMNTKREKLFFGCSSWPAFFWAASCGDERSDRINAKSQKKMRRRLRSSRFNFFFN